MTGLAGRLADAGFATGWRVVPKLPKALAGVAFWGVADLAARRGGGGVRQLRANLRRVVPRAGETELDDLTRRAMHSYARYWHEAFRLPSADPAAVLADVDISGTEYLEAALAEGNGAVVALPHTGNWDVAGLWAVQQIGRLTTVAERLEPESLYRRFVEYRESLGFEVIPADGSVSFRLLLQRLRENRVVCLVGDRDMTNTGTPVTFFGEPARFPAGPARLAASTGAALLPVGSWYTDDGWGLRIHPRIRVANRAEAPAATQALADVFAGDIAAHPTDWHMLQPFWPADREDAVADGTAGEESAADAG
ncbi:MULTISPECIES: phosphatidylinositol mannoside acyltransferase [Prauserella salsuginis group]|uniref:KDO2-lipid IV(A) lauroyltransferase n=2 Tax=Prauserella salsuginis group TaxID=2893672 RepID=A0A839Y201_9PSEU|nr:MULTISPECIES: phosphatidylinositol mannoside acyltransferase [Prauserella salsuginis group]MBB3666366.1 KDO2-lipid IV(A) lauroyltransferase [Prauserella sediminis]MCR3723087.1 KDO2-lipid IV(A) lauroyltransferase [Prauserella flava]MCR3732538.1 KDO2-lipid IV(A) lauroyltransferase [Prauserella salsuginis]